MDNVGNYTGKVIPFYRNSTNFLATIAATAQPIVDLNNFLSSLVQAFNLYTAIGAQLDVVGQWVNRSRQVIAPVPDPWFRWGDATRGWGAGYWREPYSLDTYMTNLDDDTYRALLIARIAANSWDGTAASALEIFQMFFTPQRLPSTNLIVDDHSTMEVYYAMSGAWPDPVTMELFANDYLGLEAAGVRTYHFFNSTNNTPIFGFGVNNSIIGGWGHGSWGITADVILNQ